MVEAIFCAVLVAIASKAALDAFFEGSLFAMARAYGEAMKYSDRKIVSIVGELLSCRFCLGYHVTFWLSVLCCISGISWLLLVPVALASRAIEYQLYLATRTEEDEPGAQV